MTTSHFRINEQEERLLANLLSAELSWGDGPLDLTTAKSLELLGIACFGLGLEPSLEHPGSPDSLRIAWNGVDWDTSLKPSDSELRSARWTSVPDSDSIDAILAHARLAWGALRVA